VNGMMPASRTIRAFSMLKWTPRPTSIRTPRMTASVTIGWTLPEAATNAPGCRVNGCARTSPSSSSGNT